MRPSWQSGMQNLPNPPMGRIRTPPSAGAASSLMLVSAPMRDWLDSQADVPGLRLGRLIAEAGPGDLISLVHRQPACLQMLRARMGRG